MKTLRHLSILLVLAIALTGLAWLSWLAFRPEVTAVVLRIAPPPEAKPITLPPTSPAPVSARTSTPVGIRRSGPPSVAAVQQIEAGKFVVRTEFLRAGEKKELYRQLNLRGGIFVLQDGHSRYWWLRPSAERLPLEDSGLTLEAYAFNRPRSLPPGEERFAGGFTIQPGEQLFLVMPKEFEARVLTEIEQVLPEPLTAFLAADVTLALTPSGYLEFRLIAVEHRQRGIMGMAHQFRGL